MVQAAEGVPAGVAARRLGGYRGYLGYLGHLGYLGPSAASAVLGAAATLTSWLRCTENSAGTCRRGTENRRLTPSPGGPFRAEVQPSTPGVQCRHRPKS